MSLEKEARSFIREHVPNGDNYLRNVPVPAFGYHTWQEVLSGQAYAGLDVQRKVLKRLQNTFGGKRDPLG